MGEAAKTSNTRHKTQAPEQYQFKKKQKNSLFGGKVVRERQTDNGTRLVATASAGAHTDVAT